MRRSLLIAMSALTILFTGCSEDFEVAAPYKNITIVYAMLDKGNAAHYVRIQKAFLDANKSAIDMAKVSDSNFYADGVLDVKIKEFFNGSLNKTLTLNRVNMQNEGQAKEQGMFFTSPNYAYKFTDTLSKYCTYRLVIKNNQTGDVDSAETAIITNDTSQHNFYVLAFGDLNNPPEDIRFAKTTAASHRYTLDVSVASPGKALEGVMRFFITEKNTTTNAETLKSYDFRFNDTVMAGNNIRMAAHNTKFYNYFRSTLGEAPDNIARYIDSVSVYLYASTQEYVEYRGFTQAQLGGITSNEIKPIYTNLQGGDVYGLFTTRALRVRHGLKVDNETLDSLSSNPLTQPTRLKRRP